MGDERPTKFADMIVIVGGIVTFVEQRYALYSWYMLLVVGGSRICNQIYLIPRAATLLIRANNMHSKKLHDSTISHLGSVREWNATYG